jgi:hypothetical protein
MIGPTVYYFIKLCYKKVHIKKKRLEDRMNYNTAHLLCEIYEMFQHVKENTLKIWNIFVK